MKKLTVHFLNCDSNSSCSTWQSHKVGNLRTISLLWTGLIVAGGEGFEPPTSGSGGLCPIQARLPAPSILSRHESEIINYGLWLRKEGYSIHTVYNDVKRLRRLDKHVSILEPESAKRFIASWNSGGTQHVCEVLDRFYQFNGTQWNRPYYQQVESLP